MRGIDRKKWMVDVDGDFALCLVAFRIAGADDGGWVVGLPSEFRVAAASVVADSHFKFLLHFLSGILCQMQTCILRCGVWFYMVATLQRS